MAAVAYLAAHPEIPHAPARVCFTVDEEVGHGVDHIDIAGFGDPDRFAAEAERLGTAIAGLARADGIDKIMLPGERGDAIRAEHGTRRRGRLAAAVGDELRVGVQQRHQLLHVAGDAGVPEAPHNLLRFATRHGEARARIA